MKRNNVDLKKFDNQTPFINIFDSHFPSLGRGAFSIDTVIVQKRIMQYYFNGTCLEESALKELSQEDINKFTWSVSNLHIASLRFNTWQMECSSKRFQYLHNQQELC